MVPSPPRGQSEAGGLKKLREGFLVSASSPLSHVETDPRRNAPVLAGSSRSFFQVTMLGT